MACIACGQKKSKLLYRTREGFNIAKCAGCGLAYIHPRPTEAKIRELYGEDYYAGWGFADHEESVRRIKKSTFSKRFDVIEKYVKRGKILDVGCAMGFSLEVAVERGWAPYGVELSAYSSGIAKRKFGRAIFAGTLERAGFKSGFFDAVLMSDLLEHVSDPNRVLREAARILRVGGILAITTPDMGSLSSKVMKAHWPNIKFEHLFYFSPENMARILEKNGFRVMQIAPARKTLNLAYFHTIFNSYRRPLVTPLINAVMKITPKPLASLPFQINAGDMFVIAVKKPANLQPHQPAK